MGDFYGLKTESIQNPFLRLQYLTEAGPRLVRLFFGERDENLLAETPDLVWDTPNGLYHLRGGHRLWASPEDLARSCFPDDQPVEIERSADAVTLHQPRASQEGLYKTMTIHLDPNRPVVTIEHVLGNRGETTVRLAAWAITQLALGGIAVLPQNRQPADSAGLLPNRNLVLWPYTRWADQRLQPGDEAIFVTGAPAEQACKLGYLNRAGWLGYAWKDLWFTKHFQPAPEGDHMDLNCNAEVYVKDRFIELETLSSARLLSPGNEIVHRERWQLAGLPEPVESIAQLRQLVRIG
jgi:hypothetical protein